MNTFTTLDTFEIKGRGLIHLVSKAPGQKIPAPGDMVLLDGVPVKIRGVECHAISREALEAGSATLGLLVYRIPAQEAEMVQPRQEQFRG